MEKDSAEINQKTTHRGSGQINVISYKLLSVIAYLAFASKYPHPGKKLTNVPPSNLGGSTRYKCVAHNIWKQ